jgi:glycosyltransferase involved in cell wall biosynthesis
MRVVMDTYWWNGGPPSGRNVVRGLVGAWSAVFPEDELHVLVPRGEPFDGPPSLCVHSTSLRPHGIAVTLSLGNLAKRVDADVCIAQNFGSLTRKPFVFVHDVMYVRHPEWFTRPERAYFALMLSSLRLARTVLTSSVHEAEHIASCLPRPVPVYAVGLAGAANVIHASPLRPPNVTGNRFLLAVGRLNVRKNIGRLLDAYEMLCRKSERPPDLIVVGSPDGAQESAARPGSKVSERVHFMKNISDPELSWLYRNCAGFVYPSFDEGYGLPPVEARQLGAPVAVSDIAVFHETLGDDAIYFDPRNPASIVEAIEVMLLRGPPSGVASGFLTWPQIASRIRTICTDTVSLGSH